MIYLKIKIIMKTDRKKAERNFFWKNLQFCRKEEALCKQGKGWWAFASPRIGPAPPLELAAALEALGTPAISDGMNHFNTMDPAIRPILERRSIAGPAATLRLRPGDNLMLHKSLGLVRPGDVLVVDTCGCTTSSILGELIATAAFQAGLAGIVIDGGIRDIQQLKEKAYPIFARFVTPAVGGKDGPGEFGYPISCGGVPVHPGDLIVGDTTATRQMGIFGFEPHQTELTRYQPGCFIDITDSFPQKKAAMACFQAQSHLIQYYTDRAAMRGNHARRLSGNGAIAYAESFSAFFPYAGDGFVV